MINFLHNFLPAPILLDLGLVKIHWYGLLIVLAILAGLAVAIKLGKRAGRNADAVIDLAFYLIVSALIGARLYAVLLFWPYYIKNPWEIIAVWHGGLAIHGVIIGGVAGLIIYCWQKKQDFWLWADLAAPVLALGQVIGRFGNYFNQENFGQPTAWPWGIPISPANRPAGFENFAYFHPTFLYESALNLLNFLLLLALFYWLDNSRIRKEDIEQSRSQETNNRRITGGGRPGLIFFVYLINYSVIRILLEFWRIDETPLVLGFRWPMIFSGVLLLIGLSGLILKLQRQR